MPEKKPNITIIRHSNSAYPKDTLSAQGIARTQTQSSELTGFDSVLSSPQNRALETAIQLGINNPVTDERFREIEFSHINAPIAHEYVLESWRLNRDEILAIGQQFIAAIQELAHPTENTLIISHNLIMSALLQILTQEVDSFEYLEKIELCLEPDGNLTFIQRLK